MKTMVLKSPIVSGRTDTWKIFQSVAELAANPQPAWKDATNAQIRDAWGTDDWAGGSYSQAKQWAVTGRADLVAPSDKLVSKFERDCADLLAPSRPIVRGVVGGAWDVPAVFAGHPLAARVRGKEPSNRAPLTVIATITSSAAWTPEQVTNRGTAILALVRLLSRTRAVTLYALNTAGDHEAKNSLYKAIKIDANPLDLARAAYVLTCPAVGRRLSFVADYPVSCSGPWPYGGGALTIEQQQKVCTMVFPGDLLCIPGMYMTDKLATEPEAWVREQLQQYGKK